MNWILPDPDPTGLPMVLWVLQALLLLTFFLHVLVMNVVVAGGPLTLWALWRGRPSRRRDVEVAPLYRSLADALTRLLPVATAFAITTGVAPLLFLQVVYGQVFYTSSVLMAWVWLSVVALLLGGYYAWYGLVFTLKERVRRQAGWLALGATIAFLLVSFIFVNNMTLMQRPPRFGELFLASDAGLHLGLDDPTVWPRYLHFLVGAFALAGVVVAWLGASRTPRDPTTGRWLTRFGVRLFGGATLLQIAVGAWFVGAQPDYIRRVLLGGGPDSMLLAIAIVFGLLAIPLMRASLPLGSIAIGLAVADMVVVRQQVRMLALTPYFRPDSLAVSPQVGVFLLFVVLLVGGLLTVAWMVRKLAAAGAANRLDPRQP